VAAERSKVAPCCRSLVAALEIGFAFWVAGSFQRSAIFLVAFVGVATLFQGVTQIVLAFQLRKLDPEKVRASVSVAPA